MRIWNYAYTPNIWSPVCTVFILLVLAVYGWRRRSVPGALAFAAGSLLAAIWVACSALEYAAVDVAAKIFWLKAQVIWQLPATTAITCCGTPNNAAGNKKMAKILTIEEML